MSDPTPEVMEDVRALQEWIKASYDLYYVQETEEERAVFIARMLEYMTEGLTPLQINVAFAVAMGMLADKARGWGPQYE